ncbi:glycosyltransferase family 4 protein [Deefgea salmonis]|uniref:Glycosyltransferase family 4 protein n=1 Tax=Deefgea salmonis TaxID=2875502 RepID=A0ABS8BP97_9NEIS|nr:glycosyltransferase family 1 protein [Deefgea salmonis]MCB5197371.1 glycosyltransferase family 4 protein [Deefgea salmonis]
MKKDKIKILLEMRPALEGYAGIPQETRLLFRGLCLSQSLEVEGLLQTSLRFLTAGIKTNQLSDDGLANSERLNRHSKVILSIDIKPIKNKFDAWALYLKRRRAVLGLTLSTMLRFRGHKVALTTFESRYFEDFIWQTLFAKTLPAIDYSLVTKKNYKICATPWNIFQTVGLNSRLLFSSPIYPQLDTADSDIFISQTPYPARVNKKTTLVVRYHDALPIFMSHAFANKSRHQAVHFNALLSNVQSGAYFACVSEATRQDLLKVFPEVKDRAVTIHNMVAPDYFYEDSSVERVSQIIRARLNFSTASTCPDFRSLNEKELFYQQHLGAGNVNYLLMVSTIEPRKNHTRLIAAWENIRAEIDPSLKLVIVGGLGWDVEPIMREMRTWIDQGKLFVLNNVPSADLRVLYRHAQATVCPSIAEGFDFSGVEAMSCGSVVIASDIAVHREIYDDAAEYFDPHSTDSLIESIKKVRYSTHSDELKNQLHHRGLLVAKRYDSNVILPVWEKFLQEINNKRQSHI